MEREDNFRLKRFKELKIKKAGGDDKQKVPVCSICKSKIEQSDICGLCKKCAKPKEPKPTTCPLCEKGDKEDKPTKTKVSKKDVSKQEIAPSKKVVSKKDVSKQEIAQPKQDTVISDDNECSCLKNAEGDVLQLLCASCQKKILTQNECSCLKKEEEIEISNECSCPDLEIDENRPQRAEIIIHDECSNKKMVEKDQNPCQAQQALEQNVCSCDQLQTKDDKQPEIPEIIIKDLSSHSHEKMKTKRHVSTQKDCTCDKETDIERPERGDVKQSPSSKIGENEQQQKIFINKLILEKICLCDNVEKSTEDDCACRKRVDMNDICKKIDWEKINKLKDDYLSKEQKEECSCGKNTQMYQDDTSKETCSICEKDLKKEKPCACNHSLACLTNVSGKSSKNSLCSNCKKEAGELKCSKSDPGIQSNRQVCNQCQKEGIKPATKNNKNLRAVCSTCESKNDKIDTNQTIEKRANEIICEKCKKERDTQNLKIQCSENPSNDGLDSNTQLNVQKDDDLLKASSHIDEIISLASRYQSSNSIDKLVGACKEVKSRINELSLNQSKSNVDSKCSCKNLPEKDTKTSNAGDSEDLGVYVTKFQKVVKVKRYENDDGTVKEERKVITITTESKNPSTDAKFDDHKTKKQSYDSPITSSVKQKVSNASTPSGKMLKITLPPESETKQKPSNTTVLSRDVSINSYTSCNMSSDGGVETKLSVEHIECNNIGAQREPSQQSDMNKCQCKSKSPDTPATRSVSDTGSIDTKTSNTCCAHHNDPSQSKSCCTIKIVPKPKGNSDKNIELANNCLELLKKILLESDQSRASGPSRKNEGSSCSCNSQKSVKSSAQSTNVCSRCSSKEKVQSTPTKGKPCCKNEKDKTKEICCHVVSKPKKISSTSQCNCNLNLAQQPSSASNSAVKNNCCKKQNSNSQIKCCKPISPKESSCNCRKEKENHNKDKCVCKQSSKRENPSIQSKSNCSCKTTESPKEKPSVCSMCKSKMNTKANKSPISYASINTPKSSCCCLLPAAESNSASRNVSETACCPNKIPVSCPTCSSKNKESTRKCNYQSGNVHQAWYLTASVPNPYYQQPEDKQNEQYSNSMCSLQTQCIDTPECSQSQNNSRYQDNKGFLRSGSANEENCVQIFKSEQNCCIGTSSSTPFFIHPQTIAFCPMGNCSACSSKPKTIKSCCNSNVEPDTNKSQIIGSSTTPKPSKDKLVKVECSESTPSLKSCCNQTDNNQCCPKNPSPSCPLCKSKIKVSPCCAKQPQTVSSGTSTCIPKSKTCSCSNKEKSEATKNVCPIPPKPPSCKCLMKKELDLKCCSQPKTEQKCCALAASQKSCCDQTAINSKPQPKQSSCSCKSKKSNIGQSRVVGIKTASNTNTCCDSNKVNENAGQCCKESANNKQVCCSTKKPETSCCKKPENDTCPKQSKSNCPICSSRMKPNESSCTCKSKDKPESNLNKNNATSAVCCSGKQQEQTQECCKTPDNKKDDSPKSNCPVCSLKQKPPSCTCAKKASNKNDNKEGPKESFIQPDNKKCSCNSVKAATPDPCCKEPKSECCPKDNPSCKICSDNKQSEEPSCTCGNKSKTKQENSCSKCGAELKPKPPSCICKKDADKSKECCKDPEESKDESCPICSSKNKQPKKCSSCGSEIPPKPPCPCAEKAKKPETPKPCCQQPTENKPCCNKEKENISSQMTCTCSPGNAPEPKGEPDKKCTCTSKSNENDKPDTVTKDKSKGTSIDKKDDKPEQCPICARNKSKCSCRAKSETDASKQKNDPCPSRCPSTQKSDAKVCPTCGSQTRKGNKQTVERVKSCCCCLPKDIPKNREKNSKVSVQTIQSQDCPICGPKTKNAETSTRRSDRYDVRNLEMIKPPQPAKKVCTCSSESYVSLRNWDPPMPTKASSYHGRCFH